MGNSFHGFPRECIKFYLDLAKNNNREWFNEHREEFDEYVMEPAKAFVYETGKKLQELYPDIVADPRIDKSIFRINRDTRFAKDKTPYKINLGIFFWEGDGPKMERPGFYLHIEPSHIMLAGGKHTFPKHLIKPFRDSIVHPKHGKSFSAAIKKVADNNSFEFGGEHYKKVPKGYDASNKNAKYLLHNGLYAYEHKTIPPVFFTPDFVDYCLNTWEKIMPLYKWVVDLDRRASKDSKKK